MKRSTSLLIASALTIIATAQQAPHDPTTRGQHLAEVNGQWRTMDPTVFNDPDLIDFASEADRIAAHLHAVRTRLLERTPHAVVSATSERRHALLDTLNAYADLGRFPVNTAVPGRSPVFIDELGTACAVGHLMIASGHAELAQRIHEQMNLAYIHDIDLPEVAEWASTNGFTTDELAWIQPTYEHMKHRDPYVIASLHMTNGDQMVVQRPLNSNDAPKLHLVRKDDGGEKVLAKLPMLSGVQVAEYNGHLFIGGMPPQNGSSAEVYEWTGSALLPHNVFPGRSGIDDLHALSDTLHIKSIPQGMNVGQERYLTANGVWTTVKSTTTRVFVPAEIE